MLIRYGYDITVMSHHATPMVCLLSVHDERSVDVRSAEQFLTKPAVASTTYCDLFGNTCRRLMATPGDFSIWGDGTVEDSGLHDPVAADAAEIAVRDLPDDCVVYLMGSRYCETDKLSQIAWTCSAISRQGGAGSIRSAISST